MTDPDAVLSKLDAGLAVSGVYVGAYFDSHHDAIAHRLRAYPGSRKAFWDALAEAFAAAVPPIVGRNQRPLGGPSLRKSWDMHCAKRARQRPADQPNRLPIEPRPVSRGPEEEPPMPRFPSIGQPKTPVE
jgi:hypothetical protein